jgi:hypothetical protein
MICFLKFDFFCFVGVTMQVSSPQLKTELGWFVTLFRTQLLIVVLSGNRVEFGLTITAIPVVLVLLIFAGIAVKREIKW